MSSHTQLDVLVQLHPAVVADIFTRVLNDPLTTNPQSAATLPRRLRTVAPEMLLWWDSPSLKLNDDGAVTVSVTIAGGVHQASLPGGPGRIASVSGTLSARMKPVIGQLAGSPHIALELESIDQSGLRASYAGSNPLPLAGTGGAPDGIVQAVVRDAISLLVAQPTLISFLRDLGKRPLTLSHAAFPLASAPAQAPLQLYWPRGGELLAFAIPAADGTGDLAHASLGLPSRADSNAAVTVSSRYLTTRMKALFAAGTLAPSLRDLNGSELARLDSIEAHLRTGELVLLVRVAHGYVRGTLDARVALALDATTGKLAVTLRHTSVDLDTVPADAGDTAASLAALSALPSRVAASFWTGIVAALLGAREEHGALDVTQHYVVPGTQVAVAGRATAIELADDALTIYASLPTDAVFVPEPPHRQPSAVVAQDPLHIPTQSAPGQPVAATIAALVTSGSYPPYDYAWGATGAEPVSGKHGQSFTVRGVPSGIGADVERLAEASVTVIDSFGQTSDATGPVLARPARRPQRSQPRSQPRSRSLLRIIVPALLIAAVIIGGGFAFAGNLFPAHSSALPPAISILPQTDYQQVCTLVTPALPALSVTLDNAQNTAAIAWSASVQGTVPGNADSWATLNGGGASATGTLQGGQTAILVIQPASDLCAAMQSAGARQRFIVGISYNLAGSVSLQQSEGAAASVVAPVSSSRTVTLSDTIAFSSFSAYVLGANEQPSATLEQSCNQDLVLNAVAFAVILDNAQGTAAASWELAISDQVPPAGANQVPWANAATLSGTVSAGQRSRVVVVPVRDLCRRLLGMAAPVPLHLVVRTNGRDLVTLTDTVMPPQIVRLSIQPLSFQQSCAGGLQPVTVTLDNTKSTVPVTWQVGAIDSVAPSGTPTPTSGAPWASASPSSGTLDAGTGTTSTAIVTITPDSTICTQYIPQGFSNAYHLVFTYASDLSFTVTDTISSPIP